MKARRPLFHEILFNSTLPPLEKSIPRLGLEATLIVIAGSGTVGIALTQLHYQLLSHPDKFAQLKKELHGCHVDSDITWQELKKLPYLTACIDEILRISHTTTHRLARVASEGGLQSKQYHIPAGNTISMSTYLTHTDPSLFPDPHAFIPERWLLPEGKALSKYVNPFSKGPRICLGIEALSHDRGHPQRHTKLFETTREDVEIVHDFFNGYPMLNSWGVTVTAE